MDVYSRHRAGDSSARDELITLWTPFVERYARWEARRHKREPDAWGDIFCAMVDAIDRLPKKPRADEKYVRNAIIRAAIGYESRDRAEGGVVEPIDTDPTPDMWATVSDIELTGAQKQVAQLRREGHTTREIAHITGMSKSAVSRIIKSLDELSNVYRGR